MKFIQIKALFGLFALLMVLAPQSSYSNTLSKHDSIRCTYRDGLDSIWDFTVEFHLLANFIHYNNNGTIKTVLKDLRGSLIARDQDQAVVGIGSIQQSEAERVPYKGRKYPGYLRFKLDSFEGLDIRSGFAYLIISPEAQTRDNGMRYYDAVLDVHYNDHHGDYVPVICEVYRQW